MVGIFREVHKKESVLIKKMVHCKSFGFVWSEYFLHGHYIHSAVLHNYIHLEDIFSLQNQIYLINRLEATKFH